MKYKRYLYGGQLVIFLLLSTSVYAQQMVVNFAQSEGKTIAADRLQFSNILIEVEMKNPFYKAPSDNEKFIEAPLDNEEFIKTMTPYEVIFKLCSSDDGKESLQAIRYSPFKSSNFYPLFGEEPFCLPPQSDSSLRVGMVSWDQIQLLKNPQDDPFDSNLTRYQSSVLKFNPETLKLEDNGESFYLDFDPYRQVTILLHWTNELLDLDAHLTQVGEPSHLYRDNHFILDNTSAAKLVWQEENGDILEEPPLFEPNTEIVTLTSFVTGQYQFSVHHFQGNGNIASSGAEVGIWINNEYPFDGPDLRFLPPPRKEGVDNDGSLEEWRVFEIREVVIDGQPKMRLSPIQNYKAKVTPEDIGRKGDRS